VSTCCSPGDFDDIFSPAQARSDARTYRSKGLDAEAARIADAVRSRTKPGFTVLEIGGGIGALQIELLRDGASFATNVELSRSYETVASELLAETGLSDRVARLVGDVAGDPSCLVPLADAVILQRVVCCYPNAEALVRVAAQHARRVLVLTFPIDRWWTRSAIGVANVWPRLRGSKFRAFVHPTHVVVDAASREGLALEAHRTGFLWQMLVLARERPA
jgi:magnesium-protoporphyrin O-methyltransferase